jgi:LacI family transcriptional regulator
MPGKISDVKAPTIRDVAAAAGVSASTASRALNGISSVDPAMRQRVLDAVEKLGYRPSHTARSLARGHTSLIGAVVPDLTNPYFIHLLSTLSAAAVADGYRIVVGSTAEEVADEFALAQALLQQTDGVVLCGPRMPLAELQELSKRSPPLVMVNRFVPEAQIPGVVIDEYQGALELAGYLFQLGHRKLLYLKGPHGSWPNSQRERALQDAAGFGLKVYSQDCGSEMSDGHQVAEEALAKCRELGLTGIIAHNDFVALGVLSRFRQIGVSVPGELSIAGFDDLPYTPYVDPPLTTVGRPIGDLARLSWQCLRARLWGEAVPESPMLKCTLILRASTAAVQAVSPVDATSGA